MTIDPTTVPAAPLYTVTLTSAGGALLNGEEVPVPPGADPHEVRIAALREVQIKAALLDRPVRVTAKEVDGSAWHLIVPVSGSPITLAHPHPQPAPTPLPAPPTAPVPAPAWHPQQGVPYTAPAPAYVPPPAPQPFQPGPVRPAAPPPAAVPVSPVGPAAGPAADWAAPLPVAYRPWLERIRQQEEAGDLGGALVTAEMLETALEGAHGPHHPHTVNALGVRAWLAFRRGEDWAETTSTLLQAVARRREAGAPEGDTRRLVKNARLAWRQLAEEDPEYAQEIAADVVEALEGDDSRARAVIRWIESGAARGR
ncbi:hypothetical protein ABZX88_34350 [Kitasatospora aureofaciens]|uniref:hypothetical protein n=1 Tax=Kitasatospora aureofaciens TaxID=1894 RepID=UPI0033B75434